jgi:anti-anti-sigma factor
MVKDDVDPTAPYGCEISAKDGDWRIALTGEIDLATVPEVEAVLRLAQPGAWRVALDLRGLRFMDSSAVAMLARARASAERFGNTFAVAFPSQPVRRILALCGMDRVLEVVEEPAPQDARRHALIATDLDGTVVHWNRDAEALYGWKAAEALNRPVTDIVVAPNDEQLAEEILETVRRSGIWEGDFDVRRRDGDSVRARVRETLVRDDEDRPAGIVGISFPTRPRAVA